MNKRVNPSPADALSLGDLPGALGYALRRAQLQVFADFGSALRPIDLRPAQYGVLVVVGANPGVNQSAVCQLLGFKQANLVALINLLVKRGLAERRKSAQDARSSALFLTAAGQLLLKRARRLQQQHERRMVKRLGDDGRSQLLQLLGKLS